MLQRERMRQWHQRRQRRRRMLVLMRQSITVSSTFSPFGTVVIDTISLPSKPRIAMGPESARVGSHVMSDDMYASTTTRHPEQYVLYCTTAV